MAYKPNSIEAFEEHLCNCGAGHGSGEGHAGWCKWLGMERFAHLAKAAAEFIASPSLHKVRVQGRMMSRKQVSSELSA